MKADENTTNGNEKISITVHVACENGEDAKDVQVTIKAHDRNPFAETCNLERTGTTNLSGNVEFKISATYDKITSVLVNGSNVEGYGKEIGLSNKHVREVILSLVMQKILHVSIVEIKRTEKRKR